MKLCPQCDFIYEDDQSFCDMDGKELVCDAAPVVIEANPADLSSATPKRAPGRRSIGLAAAVILGVVLTSLGSAAYFAGTQPPRSSAAAASDMSDQSTAPPPSQFSSESTGTQPVASDADATQAASANSARQKAEQSLAQLPSQANAAGDSSRAALSHARLAANPVSTQGPAGNSRGPVIVQLSNGASIKADEAWEKREGVWYRQAGVVTFLKRNRVRTIERVATPAGPSKSTANTPDTKRKAKNTIAQNQLTLARLEPVDARKESRVTSFLKKTGRILKRPFQF